MICQNTFCSSVACCNFNIYFILFFKIKYVVLPPFSVCPFVKLICFSDQKSKAHFGAVFQLDSTTSCLILYFVINSM